VGQGIWKEARFFPGVCLGGLVGVIKKGGNSVRPSTGGDRPAPSSKRPGHGCGSATPAEAADGKNSHHFTGKVGGGGRNGRRKPEGKEKKGGRWKPWGRRILRPPGEGKIGTRSW